ncbi:MAG TPA: APC family permease, partial [Blastocatellia bacterium]|nr:APC family permease [Blastocatellia bacterium]
ALTLAVALNILGLNVAKWLHNIGAVCIWVPAFALVVMGFISWSRFGAATQINAHTIIPSTHLKDVIFWSTIAFAFGGVETASSMGDEIKDARRVIPRALITAGIIITTIYIVATAAVLVALPSSEVTGLQGVMQAVESVGGRVGAAGLTPIIAALVVTGSVGAVGAWFAATARLPFVAGIDRFLPPMFGSLHPKWGTPHVALLTQAMIAAVIVFLGQAGTNVKGAYDVLVSMGVIAYFIPFLYMFAAMIRLQGEPAAPGVIRVPGGKPAAMALAAVGFLTTALSILLALIPADDEPNKRLAVAKIVGLTLLLVAIGQVMYMAGKRKRPAPGAGQPPA